MPNFTYLTSCSIFIIDFYSYYRCN